MLERQRQSENNDGPDQKAGEELGRNVLGKKFRNLFETGRYPVKNAASAEDNDRQCMVGPVDERRRLGAVSLVPPQLTEVCAQLSRERP